MASKLAEMQARFQQKQIQEREQKLLRLYESQQQKAFEKVNRGSAGSINSLGSTGGGKVRQMFDERRQKAGVDRSHPLEPLKGTRTKMTATRSVVKTTTKKSVTKTVLNDDDNNNDDARMNGDDRRSSDIVDMLSKTYLTDFLDNEEMPEIDGLAFTGKLANLGGKLPSQVAAEQQKVAVAVEEPKAAVVGKPTRHNLGKTFRKETKPVIKRSVKPSQTSPNLTSSTSHHPKTVTSPVTSPVRTVSQTMQSASKTTTPVKNQSPPARVPCNARPSSKQTAKSPVVRDDLNECRYCNRRFAVDRLEVHESICGRTAKKKRKTFDATKHRIEGTELEQYVRRGKNLSSKPSKQSTKKDWRRTHEEFINAIRAAKMAQAHLAKGGKLSDLPPPPPSSNPDYVQCPHCGRKFNESAAERHIPKCANFQFNKPKPGPKGKVGGKR